LNKQFVCGDIGGTKTILQSAEISHGKARALLTHRYDNHNFATFSEIFQDFLDRTRGTGHPLAACFAVAGPVVTQQVELTNLPWKINSSTISAEFSIPSVKLINDFEAAALGIESLSPDDMTILQTGKSLAHSMRVALGAGTGMGVAWLTWLEGRYFAVPTEAGHMDFAPTSMLQIQLLEALHNKFGHVSVERLLSGSGLTNIFKFLQMNSATASNLAPIHLEEDSGATITTLALTHQHPVAIKSINLFADIYGAYAGNLALTGLTRGGVYIAGGIAPKILNILKLGGFMRAFHAKGRFSELMHEFPVYIITNPEVGLLGARQEAHHLLNSQS
jgi:glucokinase